mgnify:CR=1 FL=1|tara:strand:- start:13578 stop:14948 length:1371 start_codon:yes stop_codon:yes gene_type:complete
MSDVFVNRTINFKRIKYFGFDMDHTLVQYNSFNFEQLTHDITVRKLIEIKNYPEEIKDIPFEYDRIIRGLVVDKIRGNLIKLNIHGYIRASYHGTKLIPYKEQKNIYRGAHLDIGDSNYISVDTAFSVAYGNLFAHLVEKKDLSPERYPSYEDISQDLLEVIDEAHRDKSLKTVVKNDLEKYIKPDPDLIHNLEKYKRRGKKLFVLTNSEYYYAKVLLDYAVNPYLQEHEHWSELFEYVITQASKPRFFYDKLDFLKIEMDTGKMSNVTKALEPGIYQGGSANYFTKDLNVNAEEILYVGDHIYGDILRLKKDCAWRTALVIEELDDEVEKLKIAKPHSTKINELMAKKAPYEKEIILLEDQREEDPNASISEEKISKLYDKIGEIDKELSEHIQAYNKVFNPHWGEVMRTGNEESYFAGQVARYACIYAATLNDILSSSPRSYFRGYRRDMPHES